MARKLFFIALGILAFFSTAFMLSSCKLHLAERDFVLSQKRDSRLIGTWKKMLLYPDNNDIHTREYTSEGELKCYDNGKLYSIKSYYYTKGNILYVLELGDGFKRSNWTREFEYRFSEDEKMLLIKWRDGSTLEEKWQRIVSSKKE